MFHLSSAFHHTYTRDFPPNTTCISSEIWLYSIVLVLSSVVDFYFDTIAHDFFLFSTKSSVFSQQFSCERHKLLNHLWIDLLQIGTGTDWLNSFIKSRKLLLRSCFTGHINVRSPCLLVDLGRHVHRLFSIFSHGSNLFKNLDTADRLNPMIFPIFFF